MMKNILNTIVIAVSCAAALSSCSKQNFDVDFVDPVDTESNDVTISLVAAQDQTKAFLLDDYTFRWDPSGEDAVLFERISNQEASLGYKPLSSNSFELTDGDTKANFVFSLPTGSMYYDHYKSSQLSQVETMLINNSQFKEGTLFSYDMIYPAKSVFKVKRESNEVCLGISNEQNPDEYSKVPGKNILLYSHLDASEVRLSGSETRTANMEYKHLSSYARLNFTKFPSYVTYEDGKSTYISIHFYDNEKKDYTAFGRFDFDLSNGEIIKTEDTGEAGCLLNGVINHVSDGDAGFKPQFDEYWFSLIPGTFQNSTMEVSVGSDIWGFELIKDIPIYSAFKAGKIKVFDLDFTTSTTEVPIGPS